MPDSAEQTCLLRKVFCEQTAWFVTEGIKHIYGESCYSLNAKQWFDERNRISMDFLALGFGTFQYPGTRFQTNTRNFCCRQ